MKTIITLLLGMLFCIQSAEAQIMLKPDAQKQLIGELLTLRNELGRYDSANLSIIAAALKDLDEGVLTTHAANQLSHYLVDYFQNWVNATGSLHIPVAEIIVMINAEMAKTVDEQKIYREELSRLVSEAEHLKLDLCLPDPLANAGKMSIAGALQIALKTLKADNPFLVTSTQDMWHLKWTIPIAEDWGYPYAAKAMKVAAAMAANKFSYIDDEPQPSKVTSRKSKK